MGLSILVREPYMVPQLLFLIGGVLLLAIVDRLLLSRFLQLFQEDLWGGNEPLNRGACTVTELRKIGWNRHHGVRD
uniref:Uncharacterized protein n=1 Tax=Candidatus Kentrum sp. TC TaxID=2126339 RepID=A0A450Z5G1_9GAMM|nr:MAG: hypothetical protein BECKTC1821D_GA0114238_10668 [Candidatus Kentron sp. TC]